MNFTFLFWLVFGLGTLVCAIFVVWLFYVGKNSYQPNSKLAPDNWELEHKLGNIDLGEYVDYESPTYQEFSKQQSVTVARFEAQRREALTKYWAKIEVEKREVERQLSLARELEVAEREANLEKIKIAFGNEPWLMALAEIANINKNSFQDYQNLADVVYGVVLKAHKEFGGRLPIKKTWRYCNGPDINLPYWAKKRLFFEKLSWLLWRYDFLIGGPGRSGRRIKSDAIIYLKSLSSLASERPASRNKYPELK